MAEPASGVAALPIVLAGLLGAAGTAGAAYAAHGGETRLVSIAAAMALVHAPALLAIGLAPPGRLRWAWLPTLLLAAGIVLFSGDLAARALTGSSLFTRAAPIGGSLVILGWLAVAVSALAAGRRSQSSPSGIFRR